MRRRAGGFVSFILLVVIELSTPEFVELRNLSPEALRSRFQLPRDCEPSITAMTVAGNSNRFLVLIDCLAGDLQGWVPSHLPGP